MKIDDALDDDLISVLERDDDAGHYVLKIGELETPVTITLRMLPSGRWTEFRQSHAIHTPSQAGPYWTSRPGSDTPASALNQAVNGLTSYYKQAVAAGHQPQETWLVEG